MSKSEIWKWILILQALAIGHCDLSPYNKFFSNFFNIHFYASPMNPVFWSTVDLNNKQTYILHICYKNVIYQSTCLVLTSCSSSYLFFVNLSCFIHTHRSCAKILNEQKWRNGFNKSLKFWWLREEKRKEPNNWQN